VTRDDAIAIAKRCAQDFPKPYTQVEGFEPHEWVVCAILRAVVQAEAATVIEKRDAANFRDIRDLMGYVEDGSHQTVRLFQDDASREYFVGLGAKSAYHGRTLPIAIENAKEGKR
jgi:hypothetical protein